MDIEQIKILKAVNENGSINATADKLFMAKSMISKNLKQAEAELGFELLDRSGYRVKLTHKGKMYLERAEKILSNFQELENFRLQLIDDIESSISISSTFLYKLSSFIDIIKQTNKHFPHTTIYTQREVLSGQKLLMQEDVDIAITEMVSDKANIETRKIGSVKMPLVISADHEFIQSLVHKREYDDLKQYPQIILRSTFPDNSGTGSIYDDSVHWYVSDDNTKLEYIRKGLGWGRMPEHMIEKDLEKGKLVQLKKIEKPLEVDIFIARRKRHPKGKVFDFIWDLVLSSLC